MSVEVRTNPPLVMVRVNWSGGSGGPQTETLMADPFGELAAGAKNNAKIMSRMPTYDTDAPYDAKKYAKWQRDLERWNDKYHSATSVFIDGMNEFWMLMFIRTFNGDPTAATDKANFKGTRFRGADMSSCSIAARCLKEGLPDGINVSIGVKFRWEVADVVRYAVAIRDALAKSGVAQPNNGYQGAKTGLLHGHGVHAT